MFHGLESPRDPLCPSSLFRHLRMQAAQPNKLTLRNWSSSDVLAARALVGLAFGRKAFSRMLGQDVPDAKCNLIGGASALRCVAALLSLFTTTRIFVCLVPLQGVCRPVALEHYEHYPQPFSASNAAHVQEGPNCRHKRVRCRCQAAMPYLISIILGVIARSKACA